MKTKLILLALLSAVSVAAQSDTPQPLTGEDRTTLIVTLRRQSATNQAYSLNQLLPLESRNYFRGIADGEEAAAKLLEAYPKFQSPTPIGIITATQPPCLTAEQQIQLARGQATYGRPGASSR